jgi:hypothetical protein
VASASYTIESAPVISLDGDNYPTIHPGESGSCWEDEFEVAPKLKVVVASFDDGLYYVQLGYYTGETWTPLTTETVTSTSLKASLTYTDSYDVQARFRLISDNSYVGEDSNILAVVAPRPEVDSQVIARTDAATYQDTIMHWTDIGDMATNMIIHQQNIKIATLK